MFNKFKQFWQKFWNDFIRKQYNKIFKHPMEDEVQSWRDIVCTNLLAIVINTLNNLTNVEATFAVDGDSVQADPLKERAKDLERKRYDIFSEMAGAGDFYIFPATNEKGEIYHTYLTQQQVRIVQMDGDNITEAYGIIDWYVDSNTNLTYYLVRHHVLDTNGTLTIDYMAVDNSDRPVNIPEWEYLKDETVQYIGANHIGFGRYKSPASSRGLSPVYGVPLNFGCSEAEEKIFHDFELMDKEFANGESKIFADPLILRRKENEDHRSKRVDGVDAEWTIPENIFPINKRAGETGSSIDIFNPTLRFSEHYAKLQSDLAMYEKQIGTSKGILTDAETTSNATATEVRRANADTIALIDKFRTAIDDGNEMTLEADAVFLNIARDLWTYSSDWYDPFEDPAEQWSRLVEAHGAGAITTKRLTKWLMPNASDEEIESELAEVAAGRQTDTDSALESILNGGA